MKFFDGRIDLRCGNWQDVLADVDQADAVITDPPYGERTHKGQRHGRQDESYSNGHLSSRGILYKHWTPQDVIEFVAWWAIRCRGWFNAFTSHDLAGTYELAMGEAGRYVFAPLACVQRAMNVRLAGDGPSNWATWMMVSRPRGLPWSTWGALPGAYIGAATDRGENPLDRSKRAVPGGKPLWLMRAIISDYTKPGDLVCDPCAGGGTTLLAAAIEGRRAIGAEVDESTWEKACARIRKYQASRAHPAGWIDPGFQGDDLDGEQGGLF